MPPGGAYRNRVIGRVVEDGMGNAATWEYSYQGAARNSPRNLAYGCEGTSEDAGAFDPWLATDYRFTGQRLEVGLGGGAGLYDYGARYYDPALGRFIQPDLVAKPGNPQGLNRYSSVLNNPLRYTDPSGLVTAEETGAYIEWRWGIVIVGDNWQVWELDWVIAGLVRFTNALGGAGVGEAKLKDILGISSGKFVSFARSEYTEADVREMKKLGEMSVPGSAVTGMVYSEDLLGGRHYEGSVVTFYDKAFTGDQYESQGNAAWTTSVVIHELAHVIDNAAGGKYSSGLMNATGSYNTETGGYIAVGTTATARGGADASEDWAESLTAYLCPDVGRVIVHGEAFGSPTKRFDYVRQQLGEWRK